ncbi:MAG: SDR family oxidoreductase, partial [Acidimicrobiales bacterium]|nr:SDR family oxidoreductase [Acidimicrobiales bacterium]
APGRSWTVDLADLEGIEAFAERVLNDLGGLDVVINNAGASRRRLMQAITVDEFDTTMALNFESPMRLTLALLPHLLEQGSGHIVNVPSMGTRSAARNVGAYVAAKAALNAFTEALYLDLVGTGVQAHLFVPGTTATEFSTPREGNDPPFPQPPGSAMDPADVADALLACLGTTHWESFASEDHQRVATRKRADPNSFLARMVEHFEG